RQDDVRLELLDDLVHALEVAEVHRLHLLEVDVRDEVLRAEVLDHLLGRDALLGESASGAGDLARGEVRRELEDLGVVEARDGSGPEDLLEEVSVVLDLEARHRDVHGALVERAAVAADEHDPRAAAARLVPESAVHDLHEAGPRILPTIAVELEGVEVVDDDRPARAERREEQLAPALLDLE